MIEDYLNQDAVLKKAVLDEKGNTKTDESGNIKYGDAMDIKCRRVRKEKEVLTADGRTVKSSTTYITVVEINTGDMLDGKEVLGVDDWVEYSEAVGYKAYV